jgi:hypothetical protein
MAAATDLIEQLSSLSKQLNFVQDEEALATASTLTKKLDIALQKPEDAAIELSLSVGIVLLTDNDCLVLT